MYPGGVPVLVVAPCAHAHKGQGEDGHSAVTMALKHTCNTLSVILELILVV